MPEAPRIPSRLEPRHDEPLDDDVSWVEVELTGDLVGDQDEVADVEIAESRLVGCGLAGAVVERLRMTDVVLDGCDLSGASLFGAVMTRVSFESCRLSGAVLAGARLHEVTFTRCKADGVNLRGVQGTNVTFDDTVLRTADLGGATITGGSLLGCDLTDADITKATLAGARLHRSTLDGLKGVEHLREVVIDPTQLVPLALRLCAAAGIVVEEEDEPA